MNLFSYFRRPATPSPPAPAPPAPVAPSRPLPYSRLTLDAWRSSPERVSYVAELLRAPLFLDLVGMLAGLRPVSREALDATSAAVLLGTRIGHDQVIAALLAAGAGTPAIPAQPEADYAAANVMAAWEGASETDAP